MGASNEAKIGGREFASIFMIVVGMKLSDITVTILYESGETAGWMIPLISLAFILIPYTLLMSVMKRWSGKGLPEVLFQVGGKFGGTLICLAFFAGALLMTAVTSRGYVDIINVMVYQQSPLYVLYFMLMGAASYVAHRGFEAIARISWVLIFLVEAALVLLVAIMWRDVDWLRLNPWAGPGIKEIVKTGFVHSAMFAEIILASVFIPRLDSLRYLSSRAARRVHRVRPENRLLHGRLYGGVRLSGSRPYRVSVPATHEERDLRHRVHARGVLFHRILARHLRHVFRRLCLSARLLVRAGAQDGPVPEAVSADGGTCLSDRAHTRQYRAGPELLGDVDL